MVGFPSGFRSEDFFFSWASSADFRAEASVGGWGNVHIGINKCTWNKDKHP